MTDQQIKRIALEQAAHDSGCEPGDFLLDESKVVISKVDPLARTYLKLPFFLDLTSYGTNIVASCSPEIADFAAKFIARDDFYHCFESTAIYELNDELAKYGQRIRHMAEYYLPDMAALEAAAKVNLCQYPTRMLGPEDFAPLYIDKWSNAICAYRKEYDILGVGAYDSGELIGFAACSADAEEMYQIGIDVLPEYRKKGIAKALVTRLACEIIALGKVPFYCAAWSNVRSAKCAIASGFRPAWVTITSKPIGE